MATRQELESIVVELEGLKKGWGPLQERLLSTRSDLESKLANLKQDFEDAERIVDEVAQAAQSAAASLDAAMTDLEECFEAELTTAISDAKSRASDAADSLGEAARELWCEELETMTATFRDLAESSGQRISENVGERLGELREALDEIGAELKDGMENAGTETITALKEAGESIKGSVTLVERTIGEFEQTLARVDDLVSAVSGATSTAAEIATETIELFSEIA